MSTQPPPESIDGYLAPLAPPVREAMQAIRELARRVVPDGQERISYRMPAIFHRKGVVIYFAAFKKHIGLYPPVADEAVRQKVAAYAGPKGNLQFPLDRPLPLDLIEEVMRARLRAVAGDKAGASRDA